MELKQSKKLTGAIPLLTCAFIVAIASIVYELIIGGISSYLLGNSVYQFSITIGLFMTSMGIGSYLSKYIENELLLKFMLIEIALALIGGTCGFVLFYSYAVMNVYIPVMFLLIIIIGILTGFELPLITRIIGKNDKLKDTLANTTAADYIGGLIGSVVFPIILLPRLGFIKTSYLVGILNILVAAYLFRKYSGRKKMGIISIIIIIVAATLMFGFFTVEETESYLERKLYRDKIVYSTQSKYQKIVITEEKDDIRLFLNGNIQFSSKDEYRYHEALVHPALSLIKKEKKVLILGGGDGLAVREILKYPDILEIDLVDLDKAVTDLAYSSPYFLRYNNDSFRDSRVKVINKDAYQYLEQNKKQYDVVIVDLPDPNNESLNKLYTVAFYRLIYQHLGDKGVMIAQSTSPYFAPECFWIIHNTIQTAGFNTRPYHVYVPSFGDWGFNIGTKGFNIDPEDIKITVPTRYLNNQQAENLFVFGKDILKKRNDDINTLIRPILIRAYYNAWEEYN